MTTTSGWAMTRRLGNSVAESKVLEHFLETLVPGLDGKSPMRSLSVVGVWVFEFLATIRALLNSWLERRLPSPL
jgi:hypothetical protein